jgi:hypothetical protein
MTTSTSRFLRRVLIVDAVTSGVIGLVMVLGAGLLELLLAVPGTLATYAGLSLIPFAALVGWLASREHMPKLAVWAVIVCNALWAADSLLLLVSDFVAPSPLGIAFIIAQALVVAILAELEFVGLRRDQLVAA